MHPSTRPPMHASTHAPIHPSTHACTARLRGLFGSIEVLTRAATQAVCLPLRASQLILRATPTSAFTARRARPDAYLGPLLRASDAPLCAHHTAVTRDDSTSRGMAATTQSSTAKILTYTPIIQNTVYLLLIGHCKYWLVDMCTLGVAHVRCAAAHTASVSRRKIRK